MNRGDDLPSPPRLPRQSEEPFHELHHDVTLEDIAANYIPPVAETVRQHRPVEPADAFYEDVVPPTPTPEFEDSRDTSPKSPPDFSPQRLPLEEEPDLHPMENIGLSELDDAPSPSSVDHQPSSPRTPSPLPSVLMPMPALYGSSSRPTIQAPSPIHDIAFNFDDDPFPELSAQTSKNPSDNRSYFNPHYTTPPLNILPPEFQRKKPSRQQRKREKEKDRGELRKEDWAPLGMNKWRALLRANPTWKHVAKSSKSLTTKDWNVSSIMKLSIFFFNSLCFSGCPNRAEAHTHFRSDRNAERQRTMELQTTQEATRCGRFGQDPLGLCHG